MSDDLPTRDHNSIVADLAEKAFEYILDARLFVSQGADRHDYGSDVQIEAVRGSGATNYRACVQLKGTEMEPNADGSITMRVRRANLNYLMAQPYSLYACYHVPSKRLLVRYAEDVVAGEDDSSTQTETVAVRFTSEFDAAFQSRLNAQMVAHGDANRERRVDWAATPPDHVARTLQTHGPEIEVPTDIGRAQAFLAALYRDGNDAVISRSFTRFEAVLGGSPIDLLPAYLSEINLGQNGYTVDADRVRAAIEIMDRVLRIEGVDAGTIYYNQGNAYSALGEHGRAVEVLRTAMPLLENASRDEAAQCAKNLGSSLEKLDKQDEARREYERALALNPDLGEAHYALANWHLRNSRDFQAALDHLERIVPSKRSAIDMAGVSGWRAEVLFRVGRTDEAFREVFSLLAHARRLGWVWGWCARLVAEFGRQSENDTANALRFWNAYIKEHGESAPARRQWLLAVARLNRLGCATGVDFNAFKTAAYGLVDGGDIISPLLCDLVGHWAQREKDWTEAEINFRRAYELNAGRYAYCLATALNFLDRFEEAQQILEEHLDDDSDARYWYQLGSARMGLKDFVSAIQAFRSAIKLDPEYELAHFSLGGASWNAGLPIDAAVIWREAVRQFPDHPEAQRLRANFQFLLDVLPSDGEQLSK